MNKMVFVEMPNGTIINPFMIVAIKPYAAGLSKVLLANGMDISVNADARDIANTLTDAIDQSEE